MQRRILEIAHANGVPCMSTVVEEIGSADRTVLHEQTAIATFCASSGDLFALQNSANGCVVVACATVFFAKHDKITHVGTTPTTLTPVVSDAASCIAQVSRMMSEHNTVCVRFVRVIDMQQY